MCVLIVCQRWLLFQHVSLSFLLLLWFYLLIHMRLAFATPVLESASILTIFALSYRTIDGSSWISSVRSRTGVAVRIIFFILLPDRYSYKECAEFTTDRVSCQLLHLFVKRPAVFVSQEPERLFSDCGSRVKLHRDLSYFLLAVIRTTKVHKS